MLHLPIRILTWLAARTTIRIRSVLQPAFLYIMLGFASGRVYKLTINFVFDKKHQDQKKFPNDAHYEKWRLLT